MKNVCVIVEMRSGRREHDFLVEGRIVAAVYGRKCLKVESLIVNIECHIAVYMLYIHELSGDVQIATPQIIKIIDEDELNSCENVLKSSTTTWQKATKST